MEHNDAKVFSVTVLYCKDVSHAEKIATALRQSFSHRPFRVDVSQERPGFSTMVFATGREPIRAAVSGVLGEAKCSCGEMSFFGASGEPSSTPPQFMRFDPPLAPDAKA